MERKAFFTHKGTTLVNAPIEWGNPRCSHGPQGQTFLFFGEVGLQFEIIDTSRGGNCSHLAQLCAIADFQEVLPIGSRGKDVQSGNTTIFGTSGNAGTNLDEILDLEIRNGKGEYVLEYRGRKILRGSKRWLELALAPLAPQLEEEANIVPVE